MGAGTRIFISYAGPDRESALWARDVLLAAGYRVELDSADWAAGENFIEMMHRALAREGTMLALLSRHYFDPGRYTIDELSAAWAERRRGGRRVVTVRVDDVELDGIYRPIIAPSLLGGTYEERRRILLEAVAGREDGRDRPGEDGHDEDDGDRAPGPGRRSPARPTVWNLPRPNTDFTGRADLLDRIHVHLHGSARVAVRALHGMGGVGKTQLALQYAYTYSHEYDLVWWINSETPELIEEQFTKLAGKVGMQVAESVIGLDEISELLGRTGRWLLIFDNAERREEIERWLPDGSGHVIITSRSPVWGGMAQTVEVDVFDRGDSAGLIRAKLGRVTDADADLLAAELGDLPLAIAQACDLIALNGTPVGDYLDDLREHADELFGDPPPWGYPLSLAAVVALAIEQMTEKDPAAAQMLRICAHLSPEPVPVVMFRHGADLLPAPLAERVRTSRRLWDTVGRLISYGLARRAEDGPQVHRLTQAILRDTDPAAATNRDLAKRLLVAACPADGTDPADWERWRVLLPHLLAADLGTAAGPEMRAAALNAIWYLLARGEAGAAEPIAADLLQRWRRSATGEDETTWGAAGALAEAYRQLGRYTDAKAVDAATLGRCTAALGADDPYTWAVATNLAVDLRAVGAHHDARRLNEDTYDRRTRRLGADDAGTLVSAHNLAGDLCVAGDYDRACEMYRDTLDRSRRVFGPDHRHTLATAHGLAGALHSTGDHDQARELNEDTLARRRQVLGNDHPDTLATAYRLANDLFALSRHEAARVLHEETYTRRCLILGDDHPDTLDSAHELAVSRCATGSFSNALDLYDRTLALRTRVLGSGHPDTHATARLAANLRAVADSGGLGYLLEDIVARRRRALGPDDPATMAGEAELANLWREAGDRQRAREIEQDLFRRRRDRLGDDHPETMAGAVELLADLRASGAERQATEIAEWISEHEPATLDDDWV